MLPPPTVCGGAIKVPLDTLSLLPLFVLPFPVERRISQPMTGPDAECPI
jgi:hypothetical protein